MKVAFFGKGTLADPCLDWLREHRRIDGFSIGGKWPPDLGLCVEFDKIIPENVIQACRLGIINFHPAPLPQYRGRNVFAHAILNAETEWCVTAHYITAKVDTGPIIDTEPVPIQPSEGAFMLYLRAKFAIETLFIRVARQALAGKVLPSTPQDESQARYYSKDSLSALHDCTGLSGDELHRRVRALTFPGKPKPYIVVDGHKYELTLQEAQ